MGYPYLWKHPPENVPTAKGRSFSSIFFGSLASGLLIITSWAGWFQGLRTSRRHHPGHGWNPRILGFLNWWFLWRTQVANHLLTTQKKTDSIRNQTWWCFPLFFRKKQKGGWVSDLLPFVSPFLFLHFGTHLPSSTQFSCLTLRRHFHHL